MKKLKIILGFTLCFVLMLSLIVTNKAFSNKQVFAESRINFNGSERIIVVGKGEIEAEPDTVKVSFGLKTRADSLSNGQTKIRENINSVKGKILEFNKDAEVYTNYLSSYPVFENGLLAYEFDCCLIAKSKDVENANGLVDAVVEAGATSVHSVNYMLSNKEETYIKALVLAKENAENKVKAIYDNAVLVGLKEEASYNYCETQAGQKIKITAKVNACYEVGNTESFSKEANLNSRDNLFKNNLNTQNEDILLNEENRVNDLMYTKDIKKPSFSKNISSLELKNEKAKTASNTDKEATKNTNSKKDNLESETKLTSDSQISNSNQATLNDAKPINNESLDNIVNKNESLDDGFNVNSQNLNKDDKNLNSKETASVEDKKEGENNKETSSIKANEAQNQKVSSKAKNEENKKAFEKDETEPVISNNVIDLKDKIIDANGKVLDKSDYKLYLKA